MELDSESELGLWHQPFPNEKGNNTAFGLEECIMQSRDCPPRLAREGIKTIEVKKKMNNIYEIVDTYNDEIIGIYPTEEEAENSIYSSSIYERISEAGSDRPTFEEFIIRERKMGMKGDVPPKTLSQLTREYAYDDKLGEFVWTFIDLVNSKSLFSKRIKNLELRSCNEYLSQKRPHTTAEIVMWGGNACITIASWKRSDLKFVGNRILMLESAEPFWELAILGQNKLIANESK